MATATEQSKTDNQDSESPTKVRRQRRRKGDLLISFFMWVSMLCWGFFVATIVFIEQASPELQNVFSRHLELEMREEWDLDALANAVDLMYIVGGLALLALTLKALRHRRRADRFPITFILLLLFSILGIYLLEGNVLENP
jgi:hypothetical protein